LVGKTTKLRQRLLVDRKKRSLEASSFFFLLFRFSPQASRYFLLKRSSGIGIRGLPQFLLKATEFGSTGTTLDADTVAIVVIASAASILAINRKEKGSRENSLPVQATTPLAPATISLFAQIIRLRSSVSDSSRNNYGQLAVITCCRTVDQLTLMVVLFLLWCVD
jgi:hypothetical protein